MDEYINILEHGAETGSLFLMFLLVVLLVFIGIYDCRQMPLRDIYSKIVSFFKVLLIGCFISAVIMIVATFVGVIINSVIQVLSLVIV